MMDPRRVLIRVAKMVEKTVALKVEKMAASMVVKTVA